MWLDTSVPSVKFKHLWTVLLEVLVATPLVITQVYYRHAGCYSDQDAPNRSLPLDLGRVASVYQCYQLTKSRGFPAFAVQNGDECWSSENATTTYSKYGRTDTCLNGMGGTWAMDVYILTGCMRPLGMQSGAITDAQITAASVYGNNVSTFGAQNARLNNTNGYRADPGAKSSWFRVTFKEETIVVGIATQGFPDAKLSEWLESYNLEYVDSSQRRSFFLNNKGDAKIFQGNSDANSVVYQEVPRPMKVLSIKIFPLKWHMTSIALRLELYGCLADIDDCANSPCQNNGTCIDLINRYECNCTDGFSGPNCEYNRCANQPCLNGATCIEHTNKYSCSCTEHYGGPHCEQEASYFFSVWLKLANSKFTLDLLDKESIRYKSLAVMVKGEVVSFLAGQPGFITADVRQFSPKETAVAEISVKCLRNSTRNLMTTILSKIKRSLVFNPVYTELQDRVNPYCSPPNSTLPLPMNNTRAVTFSKSKSFEVRTLISINCHSSRRVAYDAEFYLVHPADSSVTKDKYVQLGMATSAIFTWRVPARQLSYGLYYVQLNTRISGVKNTESNSYGFLRVTDTALIAEITGLLEVSQGEERKLQLDGSGSYDPDNGKGIYDGMKFAWFCKGKSEVFPKDIWTLPEVQPQARKSVRMLKGGCYGTGVGKLKSRERIVQFHVDQMKGDEEYNILLVLTKDNRNASASHDVYIREEIHINVRCVQNCGSSVIPSSRLILETYCSGLLCDRISNYAWTIQYQNVSKGNPTWHDISHLDENILTYHNSPNLVTKANTLLGNSSYRVSIIATTPKGFSSSAEYSFFTNALPFGGTCKVDLLEGTAWMTNFHFHCTGWRDHDLPLTYKFRYDTSTNIEMVFKSGADPHVEAKLPVGDALDGYRLTVEIEILDSIGSSTKRSLHLRVVEPIVVSSHIEDAAGKGGEMAQYLDRGNIELAAQQATTILSVVNNADGTQLELSRKIKVKDSIVEEWSKANATNLQEMTQVSAVMAGVTEKRDELSFHSQEKTVTLLGSLTEFFSAEINNKSKADREEEIQKAGTGILHSMGNLIMIAGHNAQADFKRRTKRDIGSLDKTTSEKSQSLAKKTLQLVDQVGNNLLVTKELYEKPTAFRTKSLSMVLDRQVPSRIGDKIIEDNGMGVTLPPSDVLFGGHVTEEPSISTQMLSMEENPFTWDDSAKDVKSKVLDFELKNSNGTQYNVSGLSQEVELIIPPKTKQPDVETKTYFLKPTFNGSMQYHQISIPGREYAVSIKLKPVGNRNITVLVRSGIRPTLTEFNMSVVIPNFSSCNYSEYVGYTNCTSDPYVITLSHARTSNIGLHYIGILYNRTADTAITANRQDGNATTTQIRMRRDCFSRNGRMKRSCVGVKDPPTTLPPTRLDVPRYNLTTDLNYTMSVSMSICLYWNPNVSQWTSDGCRVGPKSRPEALQCLCNHLSSFGGNFFVAPNPIDFDKVFVEFGRIGETKNYVVLITVCGMFAVYMLALILARRSDRKDEQKAFEILHLQSNGRHCYNVAIYTGMWRKCGTSSNVAMKIYGENGESGVIQLSDRYSKKQLFARASVNNFIISLPQALGNITKIKIWHDNAGSNPSWFVSQIIINNTEYNVKWYFLCNRWLAVDKHDGEVQAEFDVADKNALSGFKFLFRSRVASSLGDGHLWLSVATRPPHSPFTRAQRVSCCLAVLMSAMVASAMFYQFGKKQEDTFKFGPLRLSVRQIVIGIQSALIVIPINLLIVTIFRKVKPPPRILSAKYAVSNEEAASSDNLKTPGCLPYFFVYIGWFLCLATVITSAVFTLFYSMQWGTEISNQWLTSVLVSLIQDVCVMQPLKVILLSMLLAWIIKKPLEEQTQQSANKTQLETSPHKKVEPLIGEELLKARSFRQNVRNAAQAVWEILVYVLFILCLMVNTYGNRGNDRYRLTKSLDDIFSNPFESVESSSTFWKWTKENLVPGLYDTLWYNGQRFNQPEGFISSRQAFLVGMPRFRQVRIKPVSPCKSTSDYPGLEKHFRRCFPTYSSATEYTTEYNMPGWVPVDNRSVFHSTFDLKRACPKPWRYRTERELNTLPYRGLQSTFEGGGYVADLGYNSPTALDVIKNLEASTWIDDRTLAVFVEFTVFEPASALFTTAKFVYEVLPTGKPLVKKQIKTLSLYTSPNQRFSSFNVACQIILLLLTVYYFIRELRKMHQLRCAYFKDFWNWMDLLQVLSATVTVVLFFFKEKYVSHFVQSVQANPFDTSSIDYVVLWYELEVYILAVVVFIVTVKLLRLLRFNAHICQMSASLRKAARHISSFSVVFLILLIAFANLGMLVFGNVVTSYSLFMEAVSALLLKFLGGDMHYYEIRNENRIIGPMFVFFYMLCMGFVLMNMFVAILNESYDEVKELSGGTFPDAKLGNFMRRYYREHIGMGHDTLKRKMGRLGYRHKLWDRRRRESEEFKKDEILGSFVSLPCDYPHCISQDMLYSSRVALLGQNRPTETETALTEKPEVSSEAEMRLNTASQMETVGECSTPAETECSSSSCELLDLISELPESLVDDDDTMTNVRQKLVDYGAVLRISKRSYRRFSASGDKFVVERNYQIGAPVALTFKGRRLNNNFQVI